MESRQAIYRVKEDIRAGRLVHLFPEYRSGEVPIVALYPNRQHLPAKVRTFIDFAVKHLAEELKYSFEPRIAAVANLPS
jgi:DNA-binding transcriptional LysR family regulator